MLVAKRKPAKRPVIDLTAQNRFSRREGQAFEEWIDASCEWYKDQKVALITKTPEPMRVLSSLGNGKFEAIYTGKAQPDYKGVTRTGRAVMFEAKYTSTGKMGQSRVTPAQAAYLDIASEMGALCFVLCAFTWQDESHEIFIGRVMWNKWKNMQETFGRKYVTPQDLARWQVPIDRTDLLAFLDGLML